MLVNAVAVSRAGCPPEDLSRWRQDSFREAVLRIALVKVLPVSTVTDIVKVRPYPWESAHRQPICKTPPTKPTNPTSWRFDWRRLKQYYAKTADGVTPAWWRQTGEVKVDGKLQVITNFDGVRGNDWRVPQRNSSSGLQWCGIFALGAGYRAAYRPHSPGVGRLKA